MLLCDCFYRTLKGNSYFSHKRTHSYVATLEFQVVIQGPEIQLCWIWQINWCEMKQNLSILQTGHHFTLLSLCQCVRRGWQICGWMAPHNGGIVHPPLAQKLGMRNGSSISNQSATCLWCLGIQLRSYVTQAPSIYPPVSPVSCHVSMHPAINNINAANIGLNN